MAWYKITIRGMVQGVGFRPYIYRKAKALGLTGAVRNSGAGVEIIVDDERFSSHLSDLPSLAKIDSIETVASASRGYRDFRIIGSTRDKGGGTIPPDQFMCGECEEELRDPADRRHGYYFITCTNCGPRFSMVKGMPYDRPNTAMDEFAMCDACKKEYTDPGNRRYHAQTIACKDCGPRLRLLEGNTEMLCDSDEERITRAAKLIKDGEMVAIKGIGGFHICSLTKEAAVRSVRDALHRPTKPFAIMIPDLASLEDIALPTLEEIELLRSPARPIVVMRKRDRSQHMIISELDTIGVMLPYSGLHALLLDVIGEPVVMTSCNLPGDPVAVTEMGARFYLTHARKIINRCDDSVVKVIEGKRFFLRRSRGFVPVPISLPYEVHDTLAVGAELDNTIAAAVGRHCFLSQFIGNTSKAETLRFHKDATMRLLKLADVNPERIVCDLHPGYATTALAEELAEAFGADLMRIQHHKAHVAAVAAEHRLDSYVGIAIDGLGYGEDGTLWGGEVFFGSGKVLKRVGHLEQVPQIGGDAAAKDPRQMLFSFLSGFLSADELKERFSSEDIRFLLRVREDDERSPLSSSAGRVLDATAALIGICSRSYEGRPAIVLESVATVPLEVAPIIETIGGRRVLKTTELFTLLWSRRHEDKGILAATAQMYLAKGLLAIAREAAGGLPIVLSGGVSYNRMISGYLMKNGVRVSNELPAGDGCISYGQIALGAREK